MRFFLETFSKKYHISNTSVEFVSYTAKNRTWNGTCMEIHNNQILLHNLIRTSFKMYRTTFSTLVIIFDYDLFTRIAKQKVY